MKILATICARAGSKGVRSKNTRDFLGRPISHYTLAAFDLFQKRAGDRYGSFTLAVNTDAPLLLKQIDMTGTPYTHVPRKEALAGDRASKIDVLRDTLAEMERASGQAYDVVLDMDLTSPLRRAVDIGNVLDTLQGHPGAEIALSVTEARRNPYFNQLALQPDGYLKTAIPSDFVARQQAPDIYDANASLYAYDTAFLRGSDTIFIQARLVPSVMPDTAVLDIDSERDFELMQLLAQYFYDTDPAFGEVLDHIDTLTQKEAQPQ